MKRISIFLVVMIGYMETVLAYIDPGTGGMIIGGGLWPFILAVIVVISGFVIKFFFKPIKKGVLVVWGKIKRKD
jgi:hypothetical protein